MAAHSHCTAELEHSHADFFSGNSFSNFTRHARASVLFERPAKRARIAALFSGSARDQRADFLHHWIFIGDWRLAGNTSATKFYTAKRDHPHRHRAVFIHCDSRKYSDRHSPSAPDYSADVSFYLLHARAKMARRGAGDFDSAGVYRDDRAASGLSGIF